MDVHTLRENWVRVTKHVKIETARAIQSATLRTRANTTALQCVAWIEEGESSETERDCETWGTGLG